MTKALTFPFVTVWQGQVLIEGLFFPCTPLIACDSQQRILDLWIPGLRIYHCHDEGIEGYIVLLPHAQWVDAQHSPGWPLCRQGNGWSSAPLSSRQALPTQHVALALGGDLRLIDLAHAQTVSVAQWLDIRAWDVAQVDEPATVQPMMIHARPRSAAEILHGPQAGEKLNALLTGRSAETFQASELFSQIREKWAGFLSTLFSGRTNGGDSAERSTNRTSTGTGGLRKILPLLVIFLVLGGCLLNLLSWGFSSSPDIPVSSTPVVSSSAPTTSSETGMAWLYLFFILAWLWFYFKVLSKRSASRQAAAQAASRPQSAAPASARPPGLWQKLRAWWSHKSNSSEEGISPEERARRNPFKDALMASKLGQLLGQRQARYMKQMLEMFENQDLEDALRHAIPLGKGGNAEASAVLGLPDPRRDLSISMRRRLSGGNYNFGNSFFAHLQHVYRQAFQKLERQGNIERAAFVLAELLEDIPEAVLFLERHGRVEQAAELAAGRGHDPATAIRLWAKLGDWQRVMQIAQQHNAYAAAIVLLEKHQAPAHAAAMRCLYANVLGRSGEYEAAVDTLWSVPDQQERMAPLIQAGLARQGAPGVRMLARQCLLVPNETEEILMLYRQWLENSEVENIGELRIEFISTLYECAAREKLQPQQLSEIARRLLQRSWRRTIAERDDALYPFPAKGKLKKWLSFCYDSALKTDSPNLSGGAEERPAVARIEKGKVLQKNLDMPIGMPVKDAGFALENAYVLTYGAPGVEVVRMTARGKSVVRRFSCPADRIIVSDNGMRALALSVSETRCTVTILDLDTGKHRFYGHLQLWWFADSYDGRNWLTYANGRFQLLDMLADKPVALWSVGDLPGPLVAAARQNDTFNILFLLEQTEEPVKKMEYWRYQNNGDRLSCRETRCLNTRQALALSMLGWSPSALFIEDDMKISYSSLQSDTVTPKRSDFQTPDKVQSILSFNNINSTLPVTLAVTEQGSALWLHYWDNPGYQLRAEYVFPGSQTIQHKFMIDTNRLLIWDDQGRVAEINSSTLEVVEKFSA